MVNLRQIVENFFARQKEAETVRALIAHERSLVNKEQEILTQELNRLTREMENRAKVLESRANEQNHKRQSLSNTLAICDWLDNNQEGLKKMAQQGESGCHLDLDRLGSEMEACPNLDRLRALGVDHRLNYDIVNRKLSGLFGKECRLEQAGPNGKDSHLKYVKPSTSYIRW